MLWLVWAAMLTPLAIGYDTLANVLLGGGGDISFMLLVAAEVALVAAIGIAVVRYRLYAIERLVNRTLVYVTLSLLLVGAYAGDDARARCRRRRRLGLGRRGGDARRRGRVPAAAVAGAGSRRPPFQPGAVRGRATRAGVRGRGARGPARAGGDRVGARGGAPRPARRVCFWLPGDRGVCRRGRRARGRRCRRTGARAPRSTREGARTAVLLHDPACSSGAICCAASSPRRRSRSRSHGSASSCGCSSPRWRRRGRGSSRPATRSAGGSSATSTTAHSSGSSRSASRSGASSARCPARRRSSRPRSIRSWTRSEPRSPTCARSQPACAPRASTTGSPPRLRDLARSAPVPVDVEAPSGARRRERRGSRLLRRVRGAHERGQARLGLEGRRCAPSARTAPCTSASPTTASAAPSLRRGSGLAGLKDRVAAHGGTLEVVSPRGEGTRIEVAIPCDS